MTYDAAQVFLNVMTDAQLNRVMRRLKRYSAAFDDIRDAIAQAVEDEVYAIYENLSETTKDRIKRKLEEYNNEHATR